MDHIVPIIDPCVGFTDWDEFIENLYCELDNLQVLCWSCHEEKTGEERSLATQRKRLEKAIASRTDI